MEQLLELNIADWAILVLLLGSVLVSLLRGFVREAVSLGAWVLAFFLATMFYPRLQLLLPDVIEHPLAQPLVAFVLLFVATLLVASMLGYLLSQLVRFTGLGLFDRLLGSVFGLVRGVVIAVALLMVVEMALQASGERPRWFTESVFIPHLLWMQEWARDNTGAVLQWFTDWLN